MREVVYYTDAKTGSTFAIRNERVEVRDGKIVVVGDIVGDLDAGQRYLSEKAKAIKNYYKNNPDPVKADTGLKQSASVGVID